MGNPFGLFLSSEHAEALDFGSSANLGYASDEDAQAASACAGHWVEVWAVADRDRGGSPELTRVERLQAVPDGPRCLPIEEPASQP
jgi:hypothetical protein